MQITWWETIVRLLVAFALGGVIGWERETRRKPAGLRTVILVSVSACLFTLASSQAVLRYGGPIDAVRAMTGIATGVGFLGAGAIVQAQGEVRWLTTAASLWTAAAIGYTVGMGLYFMALASGVIVFVTLRWLVVLEERWFGDEHDRDQYEGP